MSEKKQRSDIASLISVTLSLTALVLLVLATLFAKYSTDISEKEKEVVTSKNVVINYLSGTDIKIKDIEPGTTATYNFEISSKEDGTGLVNYEIYFEREDTNFNDKYIFYRIGSNSNIKNDHGKLVNFDLTSFEEYDTPHYKGSIKPGEKQNYVIQFYYSSNVTGSKNHLNGKLHVEQVMEENN